VLGSFHERDLVRAGSLEVFFCSVLTKNRSNVMAEGQSCHDILETFLFRIDGFRNLIVILEKIGDFIRLFVSEFGDVVH
jgi:hypothetical protein